MTKFLDNITNFQGVLGQFVFEFAELEFSIKKISIKKQKMKHLVKLSYLLLLAISTKGFAQQTVVAPNLIKAGITLELNVA